MRMLHLKQIAAVVAAACLLLAVAATPARAVAITGDRTTIDVTSIGLLNAVGIGVSGLGSAIVFSSPPRSSSSRSSP